MGGKKKLGIKQMEKQQVKSDEDKAAKDAKKKEKAGPPREKKQLAILPPDVKDPKIVAEVKKMGALTPYVIATRFGVRISAAKDFLEQLEATGQIQLVSGSHSLKIYKAAA
jgi:small subunit ribosomal protein S25e